MEHFPQFGSWQIIADYTGAVALTVIVMRFFGDILERWLPQVPRKLWYLSVSIIIMELATIFTDQRTWSDIILVFFNAFGVALTALGTDSILPVRN